MGYSVARDSDRARQHAGDEMAQAAAALACRAAALAALSGFRAGLYRCFTARADELFELCDAVLCAEGPVKTLAGLSLAPEHRREHGALYDGLNHGRIDIASLSVALAAVTLPRLGGRIVLGIDVTPWLRPDAATSSGRLFCHVHGRRKDEHLLIPGWPYSMVAALEGGRTSWTRLLDARRRPACPAWQHLQVQRPRQLGRTGRRHGHRHHPVGQSRGARFQRLTPPADPPGGLDRSRR